MSRRLISLVIGAALITATLTATVGTVGAVGAVGAAPGAEPPPPGQYRVEGPGTKEERTDVARTGAAIDEVGDGYVVVTADPASLRRIERLGYRVSPVMVTDDFPPADSRYHNYSETVAELNQIVADHPALARKISVGRSYQNRDIPAIKISDNVGVDENEPEVLFTANQHAREHLTPEQALYIANLLTDSYATDSQLRQLVDTREIWIVPMVNPDGVEYDIATGSYRNWRKNRQPNTGTTAVGTDLNRNWAYRWGCCGGSSSSPSSSTYRGPSAESAPEVRALANWVRSRVIGGRQQIRVHIDFHTYGELILWPMGYTFTDVTAELPRDARDAHAAIGQQMANSNGYTPQQSSDLYITDGSISDWMWASQGIFSYVFEMFGTNFYPPDEVIVRETTRNRGAVVTLMGYADCPYRAIGKQQQYCGAVLP
jgi:carboxypeptidase T